MSRGAVQRINVSQFRTNCSAILESVRATGRTVLITKRREVIAEVIPPPRPPRRRDWVGSMKGTCRITGDLIAPASRLEDWDAMRE